jgi:hypothetical protein
MARTSVANPRHDNPEARQLTPSDSLDRLRSHLSIPPLQGNLRHCFCTGLANNIGQATILGPASEGTQPPICGVDIPVVPSNASHNNTRSTERLIHCHSSVEAIRPRQALRSSLLSHVQHKHWLRSLVSQVPSRYINVHVNFLSQCQ